MAGMDTFLFTSGECVLVVEIAASVDLLEFSEERLSIEPNSNLMSDNFISGL